MRVMKGVGVALIVILPLLILAVHINAEVFRWRAEHLLNRVKSLRVEETPYSAIATLRKDYFSSVVEKGACTEQHCDFSINLTAWRSLIHLTWKHPWTERPQYYAVLLLRHFGLRPAEFGVWLRVERGTLRGLGVGLVPMSVIERPDYAPHGFLSNFIVTARSARNFRRLVYRSSIYKHPNLMVWEPSACTGCSGAITAEFTWQASQQEVDTALDFNLSCITAFRDCKSVEEYLPSAAGLLLSDRKQYVSWESIPCDSRMARILGRDSDFVDIVRLTKLGPPDDNFVVADYELLKPLKGKVPKLTAIYHPREQLVAADNSGRSSHRALRVGEEHILFLSQMLGHATPDSHCAVMTPTPDILKGTLEGIADDRSGGSEGQ
jgi:hypothetical protein